MTKDNVLRLQVALADGRLIELITPHPTFPEANF
jgi:hypothetical protein